jgi:hypothetical protein
VKSSKVQKIRDFSSSGEKIASGILANRLAKLETLGILHKGIHSILFGIISLHMVIAAKKNQVIKIPSLIICHVWIIPIRLKQVWVSIFDVTNIRKIGFVFRI